MERKGRGQASSQSLLEPERLVSSHQTAELHIFGPLRLRDLYQCPGMSQAFCLEQMLPASLVLRSLDKPEFHRQLP